MGQIFAKARAGKKPDLNPGDIQSAFTSISETDTKSEDNPQGDRVSPTPTAEMTTSGQETVHSDEATSKTSKRTKTKKSVLQGFRQNSASSRPDVSRAALCDTTSTPPERDQSDHLNTSVPGNLSFDEIANKVDQMHMSTQTSASAESSALRVYNSFSGRVLLLSVLDELFETIATLPNATMEVVNALGHDNELRKAIMERCQCVDSRCRAAHLLLADQFTESRKLKQQHQNQEASSANQMQYLQRQLISKQSELNSMATQLNTAGRENREVKDQYDDLRGKLDDLKQQFYSQQSELKTVSRSLTNANYEKSSLTRQLRHLQTDRNDIKQQLDSKQEEVTQLTIDLAAKTSEAEIYLDAQNAAIEARDKAEESEQTTLREHQDLLAKLNEDCECANFKWKAKRLELENAEIPLLRTRAANAEAYHKELLDLRVQAALWKEQAETANALSEDLSQTKIAMENMKFENRTLKKNATRAEVVELKEKLHKSNVRVEELAQCLKTIEEERSTDAANSNTKTHPTPNDTAKALSEEAKSLSLHRFHLSSPHPHPHPTSNTYIHESVRLLKYLTQLQNTAVARAKNISETRAGMGWSAYEQLEGLMGFVAKETGEAVRLVLGLRGKGGRTEERGGGSGLGCLWGSSCSKILEW